MKVVEHEIVWITICGALLIAILAFSKFARALCRSAIKNPRGTCHIERSAHDITVTEEPASREPA
jgi:hypothetical protein